MKNLADISSADLRRAADIREQVDKLAHELHVIFGLSSNENNPRAWSEERRKKFDKTIAGRRPVIKVYTPLQLGARLNSRPKMSAAAKAKISAAAKKRWAERKRMGHKSL